MWRQKLNCHLESMGISQTRKVQLKILINIGAIVTQLSDISGRNSFKAGLKATSQEKRSSNNGPASKSASEPDTSGWAKWLLRGSNKVLQDCIGSRERSICCCNFRLTPGYCSVAGCSHYNEKNDDDTQSCRYNNEPIEDTMSMLANQEDPVTCCLLPEARLTHCASCWKVG